VVDSATVKAIVYRARSWYRRSWREGIFLAAFVAAVAAVVLTLAAGATRTATAPDRYVDALPYRYDAQIDQESGAPQRDALAALPAASRVDMVTFVFGGLVRDGEESPIDTIVFAGEPGAFALGGLKGRLPNDDAPGEFVATQQFVDAAGITIGGRLTLLTISQQLSDRSGFDVDEPDGPTVPATLVGIVDPGSLALEDASSVAVFGSSLLEQGDIGVASGQAFVSLAPGATLTDLREQVEAIDDTDVFSVSPAQIVDPEVRVAVDAQTQGLTVLALIVAAAAIVVVTLMLSRQLRLVDEERSVLTATGFGHVQVSLDPVGRAVPVVLGGCVGAVGLAWAASGLFPVGFARKVEPGAGRRFDVLVHVGGALALAALVLALLWMLSLAQRSRAEDRQPGTVERLARAVPNAPLAMGLRVAFGRGRRTGSTTGSLVAVTLLASLVIAGLTFGASIARLLDEPARYGDNYDIGFGEGAETIPDPVRQQLETNPGIAGATLYGATIVTVGNRAIGIVGMEPVRGELVPAVIEGRLPSADDEVALGRHVARDLDVGVGDDIEVSVPSGVQQLHVTGIAIIPTIEESDQVGQVALLTADGLRRADPAETLSSALIKLAPDAPDDIAAQITGVPGQQAKRFDIPTGVQNLGRIRTTPFLVAAIVGALALLAIGQLVVVATRRRRRDFAVLRALGATPRWVGAAVHWHATVTAMLTVIIAIPVGMAAGRALFQPYAERIGARGDTAVPVLWIMGVGVVLIVAVNLVAAVPARGLRRPNPAVLSRE